MSSAKPEKTENDANSREISRFDRKLLDRYSEGDSVEEIAASVPGDLSPAMVAFRIKQLLASRSGLLTAAEDAALHLYDLQRLKKKAWEMLDMEDGNRALTGLASIMQQIGLRIDIAAARSDEMMGQIRKAQAREFAAALEMMYDGVVRRLAREYPEMDKTVLRTMMGEEFQKAVGRIDKLVEENE
jgi:hypothetical protein